jgi:hypothetical protein
MKLESILIIAAVYMALIGIGHLFAPFWTLQLSFAEQGRPGWYRPA